MKPLLTLFCSLILSGCLGATLTTEANHQLDDRLKIGETSKFEIEQVLGTPQQKEVASSGYECWHYFQGRNRPKKVKTLLLSSPETVSYQPDNTSISNQELKLFIDPQGRLFDYELL